MAPVVDRFERKRFLLAIFIAFAVATLMCGVARSLEEMIVYRAIIGAAEAGLLPASLMALVIWFPKAKIATGSIDQHWAVATDAYAIPVARELDASRVFLAGAFTSVEGVARGATAIVATTATSDVIFVDNLGDPDCIQ